MSGKRGTEGGTTRERRGPRDLLKLIGARYVYRRQVPTDLRAVLGRSEFKVSLGSIPPERAKKLAGDLATEHTALFKLLRAKGALPEFLAREAEARADAQAQAREAELAFYALPSRARDERELLGVRRGIQSKADKEAGVWRRAQARALEAGLPRDVREKYGDAEAVVETHAKAKARVKLISAALASPIGDPADDAEEIAAIADERTLKRELAKAQEVTEELSAVIGPAAPARARKVTDGVNAVEAMRRKHKRQREITTGKYDLYQRHFTDLFGDISVKEITYHHVDAYVDAVAGLPNANFLSPAERQLSVEELLDLRADKDIPAVGRETVVKHVDWLKALLNFAEAKRITASNPARKVMIPEAESKTFSDRRLPFSPNQLREVMARAEVIWADDPRLWYLRLCIYSGVRPDEGAQLDVFDVKKEGSIPFVAVHDSGGKTIKNKPSVRNVPLHPHLLKLGFMDFVAGREKGRLFGFPKTSKGEHEHATRPFRSSILKGCPSCLAANGEPDRRLVWYSTRHSFADACRNGGVRDSARRQLMGHVEQGASGEYGKGFALAVLAKEIAKADPLSVEILGE